MDELKESGSEGNTEQDKPENAPVPNTVGGFFDSLIADFSLNEIPAEKNSGTGSDTIIETVDGITPENSSPVKIPDESDPVVIFDAESPENADDIDIYLTEPMLPPQHNADSDDTPHAEPDDIEAPLPEAVPEKDTKRGFFAGLFPVKGDSIGEVIRKIVFLIAVIVFICAGFMLARTLIDSKKAVEDKEKRETLFTTAPPETIVSVAENGETVTVTVPVSEEEEMEYNFEIMSYFKDINPDVVGYVELEGCDIHEPVVQGKDNDYYLTHTYYNGVNQAGSIFMDYRCIVSEDYVSPNIVLYGHNQQDRTMFGSLKDYKYNLDFYAKNPIVKLRTDYEASDYVIFAYFVTNTKEKQDSEGEVFHYHDYIETLNNEPTFRWYMHQVQRRNQIISPVDVEFGDRLLVLSTCSNEYSDSRFVVFARKLREGEAVEDFDFTTARINENAKGIDWDAVMGRITRPAPAVVTTAATEPEAVETTETTEETTVETTVPTEETTRRTRRTTEETTEAPETTTTVTTTAPPETTTTEMTTTTEETTTTAEETTTTAEETTTTSEERPTTTFGIPNSYTDTPATAVIPDYLG